MLRFTATLLLLLTAAAAQQAPASPESLVQRGVAAMQRGDDAAARSLFQLALRARPASVEAHTYLGIMADRAGQWTEAEREFAAAVAAAPTSAAAHNNLGAILGKLKRRRDAAAEFRRSLTLDPNQRDTLLNLAQIWTEEGTPESLRGAQDCFRRAESMQREPAVARALAIVSLRLRDLPAAQAAYREYRAQPDGAPLAAAERADFGEALLRAGLVDEAAAELSAAAAANPSDVASIVALARVQEQKSDWPAAGHTLETAVARGLHDARLYAELTEVYESTGHIANAIEAMRLAVDSAPDSQAYRFRYGMLLIDAKAPAAAAIRMKDALDTFPKSARLWFALGAAYFADNKTEDAASAFSRAVALDDQFAPAYAYLAMTQVDAGRYAEAVKLYDKALNIDERFPAVHYLKAEALLKTEPPDDAAAERHLRRALELDPGLSQAHLELGKIFLRSNRVDEAAKQLQSVVAAAPDIAEAHYQLGRAYQRLKRGDDAKTEFALFERLQKEQREQTIAERQKLLKQLANVRF